MADSCSSLSSFFQRSRLYFHDGANKKRDVKEEEEIKRVNEERSSLSSAEEEEEEEEGGGGGACGLFFCEIDQFLYSRSISREMGRNTCSCGLPKRKWTKKRLSKRPMWITRENCERPRGLRKIYGESVTAEGWNGRRWRRWRRYGFFEGFLYF